MELGSLRVPVSNAQTVHTEEKAGSISGDVIRLVNHVPLLDHPDWRSGVVMEACNAVDWARFGLKLVATMYVVTEFFLGWTVTIALVMVIM